MARLDVNIEPIYFLITSITLIILSLIHYKNFGKTLETTAVFNPDLANSREVLIPEPPPPITRTSNSKVLIFDEFKVLKI